MQQPRASASDPTPGYRRRAADAVVPPHDRPAAAQEPPAEPIPPPEEAPLGAPH